MHDMAKRLAPMRATTQAAEGLPRLKWSLAEFDRLGELGIFAEDDRIELIGGELVPMSPKGNRHENVKSVLIDHFYRRLPLDTRLTVELGWRPAGDNYLEPDIVLYPSTLLPADVPAAKALLVIEVAHSSKHYDLGTKAQVYAALGVREYWVIDAVKLATRVFREPSAAGYGVVENHAASATITPLLLPALAVRMAELGLD